MSRRRNTTKPDEKESLAKLAARLAQRLDRPVSDFRHVTVHFHNGRHWTTESEWQSWEGDRWHPLPWTEVTTN